MKVTMDGGPVHVVASVDLRLLESSPMERLAKAAERICCVFERLETPTKVFGACLGFSLVAFSASSLLMSLVALRSNIAPRRNRDE